LTTSASAVGSIQARNGITLRVTSPTSDSAANSTAAIGAVPYVTIRLSWLADSSCSLGTRLGTVASLAGTQKRLTHSTSSVAMMIH
jgi:hypothetical protein